MPSRLVSSKFHIVQCFIAHCSFFSSYLQCWQTSTCMLSLRHNYKLHCSGCTLVSHLFQGLHHLRLNGRLFGSRFPALSRVRVRDRRPWRWYKAVHQTLKARVHQRTIGNRDVGDKLQDGLSHRLQANRAVALIKYQKAVLKI